MPEHRSQKQQREHLVRSLRTDGRSRVEVADVLRRRYRINARVALRYAQGWSQRRAADEWNQRWPDELKTFKAFSYWELWPSSTGHAPSFDNLSKLAQLYECAVSDLLVDLPDFRHLDAMSSSTQATAPIMHSPDTKRILSKDSAARATTTSLPPDCGVLATPQDHDPALDQPAQLLTGLSYGLGQRSGDGMNRRQALKVIGAGGMLGSFTQQAAGLSELVLDAAHSSAVLHSAIDTPKIEDRTLDEARQDLYHLATDYVVNPTSLGHILTELVILRDRLYALLDRYGKRPENARELHLLLGAVCVLLASISHDLAEPSAAMIQTRTALTAAELAGHSGLITWVYCTRAMIASWWGSADDVRYHAQCARSAGQIGVGVIRLAGLEARAVAHSGNHQQAVTLLETAQDQREKLPVTDSLRDLGEVFTFSRARQHYYNAAVFAHLHDWEAVEREACEVISLYGSPAAGQRWPVTMTLSQVYLAQARLSNSGPEGAQDALAPVFGIPDEQRIPQTAQALGRLQAQLRSKVYANLPVARDLDEAIGNFRPGTDRHERS